MTMASNGHDRPPGPHGVFEEASFPALEYFPSRVMSQPSGFWQKPWATAATVVAAIAALLGIFVTVILAYIGSVDDDLNRLET